MSQFVSSLQCVASSSTKCSESVRQFVAPYIDTGTTTNTQGRGDRPSDEFSSSEAAESVSTADQLADRIIEVCSVIDRRLGNGPGTAWRGLWFWLWPPPPHPDPDVLTNLHADAVEFLHNVVTS